MEYDIELYMKESKLLKALAHPIRLCIVQGLLKQGPCNVAHMEECLHVSQSAVSQHLTKLKAAGILRVNRIGNSNMYEVADPEVIRLIVCLFNEEGKGTL